jgi:hypothetical protein
MTCQTSRRTVRPLVWHNLCIHYIDGRITPRSAPREEPALAINQRVTARDIGRSFLKAVGADPMVDTVFVEADDRVVVWLLTQPISFEDEAHFYEAGATLHRTFQDTTIDFRLINPSFFDPAVDLVGEVIPPTAEPIRLDHH